MKKAIVCIILLLGSSAYAELRLAALFSEGMVLQREQSVPIWGWADPGEKVSVQFAGQEQSAFADAEGAFTIHLNQMEASRRPQTLRIHSGKDAVEIGDILVGEVWLCTGQSNMGWPVSKSMNFEAEQKAARFPEIRMFSVKRGARRTPLNDCAGDWAACTPETVGKFSAVAYFFGRTLYQELDVPIGLLHSSWGGTRIESWSPMASLERFSTVMDQKKKMDQEALTYTEEWAEQKLAKEVTEWKKKAERAEAKGQRAPWKPSKEPHPHNSQHYPANLYNAMLHPLIPYGIRGVIWYQGESNAKTIEEALLYRDLIENMVTAWRAAWADDFPFYAVQLVNYKKPQRAPVENTGWSVIRESFLKFHHEVTKVAVVVGIDVGDAGDIHPRNKQAIGKRLAQRALSDVYGKDIVPGGPMYTAMRMDGNKIILSFEDVGSGLVEQDGTPLKTFAIAGEDRQFIQAQAVIVDDTVIVSAEEVSNPVAVRYAWADNPVGCNLFNVEGFPASPFRTDDWPLVAE